MAEAITLGRMTDTMEEGFIAELPIKVGDKIKTGDTVAEIETDKATLPLESYYAGEILHIAAKKGDSLQIGQLIAIVGKAGEDFSSLLNGNSAKAAATPETTKVAETVAPAPVSQAPAPVANLTSSADTRVKASPLAKAIAKEKGLDLAAIAGSGEEGRIVKKDVENSTLTAPSVAKTNVLIGQESFTDIRVSQMRKTIAKRLSHSLQENPHFYLTMDICMDKAMQMRTELNAVAATKVSFNDFVIKAVALAIRQNPGINTSWLGDTIRQYDHIHIGMAVAVEEGLVVPVIRFADDKKLVDISAEAKELAKKAQGKKLLPPDMEGSTFTISNLGMFGIDEFTAIINEPNACILAVGAIRETPAVVNGEIKISNRMKVTLSSDHRVVDGSVGAKFLQSFKSFLEEPFRLVI